MARAVRKTKKTKSSSRYSKKVKLSSIKEKKEKQLGAGTRENSEIYYFDDEEEGRAGWNTESK